ncbi:hypothetical protein [Brachybacterium sp. GPGPB12]|uniref:hypothetical protein n=1 Tax=Brachybacterium sp. GPGPB12 TaxID=3023517 RepID=UPI0031346546
MRPLGRTVVVDGDGVDEGGGAGHAERAAGSGAQIGGEEVDAVVAGAEAGIGVVHGGDGAGADHVEALGLHLRAEGDEAAAGAVGKVAHAARAVLLEVDRGERRGVGVGAEEMLVPARVGEDQGGQARAERVLSHLAGELDAPWITQVAERQDDTPAPARGGRGRDAVVVRCDHRDAPPHQTSIAAEMTTK